jgi:hypothetical protein
MDIWVERSDENYTKILMAFEDFGMPVFDMTKETTHVQRCVLSL